jgi:eukaryotic-like serine/threonine-protein kinase
MQPQRWEQLGELFEQLAAVAPEAHESFISAHCGTDEEIAAQLRSLWQAHGAVGPLDTEPAILWEGAELADSSEAAGKNVGPYRLLRQLGEGGMGSVWLAERLDGVVKRSIALKRPHVSWVDTLAERTIQERDILAGLEHPNIARLYDAGVTEEGEPYLALEFIDGVPITQFCNEHELTVARRLELLLQVLEAVRFAHSRLVIHRDIKPSNILVSADGRAHLLDFGIAKLVHGATADPEMQHAGALTPDYASPEQIRGEAIGTASDVYSLGVVSYECLTGARPYRLQMRDSTALGAELRAVRLKPASTVASTSISHQIKGDLDAILSKALQQEPALRYASVDAFAADIERFLAIRPVQARPDRVAYRLSKFVARNRWQTASMTVAVVALVGGTVTALWQARQARLEAARAEQVKSFALSMLESADTDAGAGAATTAVQMLQAARARVEQELAGRPAIAAELMSAIGYGLLGQDHPEEAADILKKSIALSTQANGADDTKTVAAQVMYGEALYDLGQTKNAIATLEPAAILAHRMHDTHVEVDALRWLSSAQISNGDDQAGILLARSAVAALPNPLPAGRAARQDAIQAHLGLANALGSARVDGVVDETRTALALMADLPGWNNTAHWWAARGYLGMGLVREGQTATGLKELKSAYEGAKALLGPNHEGTEINATYWANALLDSGDTRQSVDVFQIAFDAVIARDGGRESPALAYEHLGLASALAASAQLRQSIPHFEAAARLFSADGGEGTPLVLRSRIGHANALIRLGRVDDADREIEALAKLPMKGVEAIQFHVLLAELRSKQSRHSEAAEAAGLAVKQILSLPKPRRAQALSTLGMVMLAANRKQDGITLLEGADSLYREMEIKTSPAHEENTAALSRAKT